MINLDEIRYDSTTGLVPAIIQDAMTRQVLMLGYMNKEAVDRTLHKGLVTFYSRSKKRLWTKGESSGHTLQLQEMALDCDKDTLLIEAVPTGPTCHLGTDTCWGADNKEPFSLLQLERVVQERRANPRESSYTSQLLSRGINKVAQKVGEEAVELVIEAKDDNKNLFLEEAADLLYHYTVLLAAKGYNHSEVLQVLDRRHAEQTGTNPS